MQEPDYPLLHEIARHAIHVSETLATALDSVQGLKRQQRDFMTEHSQSSNSCNRIQDHFRFQLQMLQSLRSRSESNQARVHNEIALVSSQYGHCANSLEYDETVLRRCPVSYR